MEQPRVSLRGVVYDKFRSVAALAEAIGWTRQKAGNIINGNQEPSLDDTNKLAKALDLDFQTTAEFFLHR